MKARYIALLPSIIILQGCADDLSGDANPWSIEDSCNPPQPSDPELKTNCISVIDGEEVCVGSSTYLCVWDKERWTGAWLRKDSNACCDIKTSQIVFKSLKTEQKNTSNQPDGPYMGPLCWSEGSWNIKISLTIQNKGNLDALINCQTFIAHEGYANIITNQEEYPLPVGETQDISYQISLPNQCDFESIRVDCIDISGNEKVLYREDCTLDHGNISGCENGNNPMFGGSSVFLGPLKSPLAQPR